MHVVGCNVMCAPSLSPHSDLPTRVLLHHAPPTSRKQYKPSIMASASFPRHKRNNSTGSVSTAGMCSFGSFDFAGHCSTDNFSVDGGDSIVSEFERMCGSKSASSINKNVDSHKTSGVAAQAPLVLPSPTSQNAGPMRKRLGAVDSFLTESSPEVRALNLPFTPGSGTGSSYRGAGAGGDGRNRFTKPFTPSQIDEIIVSSPAPSLGVSTLGGGSAADTPISKTTMRDLLDTLNSLEDDGSSFGGSIGQSTMGSTTSSRFQPPAPKSHSSRPPRALNIPTRSIGAQRDGPNGIPRPLTGRSGGSSRPAVSSMPPMPMQRRDAPPHNPQSNTTSTTATANATATVGKGNQLKILTFIDEIQAEHTMMSTEENAQPQSVLHVPNKENSAPKLPPMHRGNRTSSSNGGAAAYVSEPLKQNNKSKENGNGAVSSGAFPTFNASASTKGKGGADENAAPNTTTSISTNKGKRATSMKPLVKPHSRVKSVTRYTTTLPSIQKPGAVLPGATFGSGGGSHRVFGERNTNIPTLAEF